MMSDDDRRGDEWFEGTEEMTEAELKSVEHAFWVLVIAVIMIIGSILWAILG